MVHLVPLTEFIRFVADSHGLHGTAFRRGVSLSPVQVTGDVLDLVDRFGFIEVR